MRRVINASDHFGWHLHRWMICPVSCSPVIWAFLSAQRAFSLPGIYSSQALISKHPLPWMIQIITTEIINCFTKTFYFDGSKHQLFWIVDIQISQRALLLNNNDPLVKGWALFYLQQTFKLGQISNVSLRQLANVLGNRRARTRWSYCMFRLPTNFL